ncbi:MAG: response regulator [Halarcobacter sp.]
MEIPILIVEDERIVSMEIESYLKSIDFKIIGIVNNSEDAYSLAMKYKPHIILMDIKIKGDVDGIDTAIKISNEIDTTFVYLTAFCDEETIERAVKTNPSAYLTKPFNKKELFASLKIAAFNYNKRNKKQKIKRGNIILDNEFSFDSKNKQLIFSSEYIHLTKREKELLHLLIESKNSIVSIYEMENEIWPDKTANENTRRALVSRLRSKMKYKFIETIPSIGYRINI